MFDLSATGHICRNICLPSYKTYLNISFNHLWSTASTNFGDMHLLPAYYDSYRSTTKVKCYQCKRLNGNNFGK